MKKAKDSLTDKTVRIKHDKVYESKDQDSLSSSKSSSGSETSSSDDDEYSSTVESNLESI